MSEESPESRLPADTTGLIAMSEHTDNSTFKFGPDSDTRTGTNNTVRDDLDLRPKSQCLDIDLDSRPMSVPPRRNNITASRNTRPIKPGDSYFDVSIDGLSANFSRIDPITEDVVREHLQDVESSFLPPISPLQTHNPEGVDDTYLFDRAATNARQRQSQDPRVSQLELEPMDQSVDAPSVLDTTPLSPLVEGDHTEELNLNLARNQDQGMEESHSGAVTPPTARKETFGDTSAVHGRTAQSFEGSPSPTAAAHARTVSRALSRASSRKNLSRNASVSRNPGDDGDDVPFGLELSSDQLGSSTNATTLRQQPSDQTLRKSGNGGETLRSGKRPKYLKSRNASQRSSASSFADHVDEGDSDATVGLGADYALQTGGAIPAMGISRSMSNMLSRSVSMGSMASGFEEFDESSGMIQRHHDSREMQLPDELDGILETPKPKNPLAAPTDTVIARHVRNVQVPESLAKEYKTQRGIKTPRGKTQEATFGTERKSKHMTLKEQSTTLDRLSKENFDLKLKVVFLNEKLGQLSEEGIKDMVKENVDLKTALAISQRDNKSLRRRTKQLEKQLKEADERPATSRSLGSDDESDDGEREEELIYLKERIEEYASEIERLKNENLSKEVEKRRMAESLRTMGERAPGDISAQEESDVWKDLLEQETARREHVDDENRRLRDELFRIKQEGLGSLHHTTNIYNISKKGRPGSPSRPTTGHSDMENGTVASSTLVDELQKDRDRLNHEVAELRREMNAQASMLTSRNREKDRLYQEIEDLKLSQRRGGPAPSTVDTILERSASRAGHDSSPSQVSGSHNGMDDAERDEYENRQAEMRDRINELKLQNQNLQTEINSCMNDFEAVLDEKRGLEEHIQGLQAELDAAENDLLILQKERDEALQEQEAIGVEFDRLRQEAQEEIDSLEEQEDRYKDEIGTLDAELKEKTEDLNSLQHKMREMSEAINQIEDKMDETNRKNDKLLQELSECNHEVENLEAQLRDSNDKTQRLNVQQENYQVEIGFLREEQENHIVKIGNLEATLDTAQQSLHEEKERAKELENRLASERRQRELVANREKEEVQQFVNELNREAGNAKDESRKLRKLLTNKEVETTEWKERLHELENNLRVALGDLNGTRSSLLKSIEKLQRELENTVRELDSTKSALVEKDRIIKQRDSLLESHGLESRKLSELLEKERQAHRNTKHQFDTFQKTHDHVSRTANSQEGRIHELETTRSQERRKLSQLEHQFRDQLTERNSLLLELWSRLSRICGSDWAHNNSLINGRALPSLESLGTMLPGFSKNLMAAVKMIDNMMGDLQGRIKGVERDLWKEYQALENQLDLRVKKVDRLEALVRNSIASGNLGPHSEGRVARLEEAYRQLKVENATLRAAQDARIRSGYTHDPEGGSPSPNVPTGPSMKQRRGIDTRTSTMRSTSSAGQNLAVNNNPSSNEISPQKPIDGATTPPTTSRGIPGSSAGTADNRWMFRLRDLEYKLKMEREARNLDRTAARQRLAQQSEENKSLRAEVVRLKRSGNFDDEEDEMR
ncbi:Anucleate primary sterigmata protein B [Zalerion maritima]|uniref:Anucleate primary sterigmata protein B n=1 Tax=Zalerion maritima TaxID=339359 RepID=A0AAD5RZ17_9PEZI|nr:Anucleate primary sterigmata protein B [Zalerion maritima]